MACVCFGDLAASVVCTATSQRNDSMFRFLNLLSSKG